MEIYNPNGFNLPPIMIEKRKYRINIEEDQKVKNFINTKLLLNNDFNKLYFKTLEKSKAVAFYFNIKEIDLLRIPFYSPTMKNLNKENYIKFYIALRKARHPSRIHIEDMKNEKKLILEVKKK